MEWIENKGLPSKMEKYLLKRNPRRKFYLFLSLCIIATIILSILVIKAWLGDVSIGLKIFATLLSAWVLFIGYYGAKEFYIAEIHQPHKIKWDSKNIYLWNKYSGHILVYPFKNVIKIELTKNGIPLKNGESPTDITLGLKTGKRRKTGIALSLEVGLKLKEAWEEWKKKNKENIKK